MKRRVAILRAIETDAPLVIMDEPFKGLDETTKQAVIAYTKKRLEGRTAIIVTHDPDEAELLGKIIKM
jgi:NitT/TauT family transport system ATP-binding protein